MRDFVATYRLQFRNGMDFARASDLVPYLATLGVSHLYASPIFAATGGSTHGYDVIDHASFDHALGGAEGFDRLARALRDNGLGLILDIVPNHMAASPENPWWRDVLEWGGDSRHAHTFDIDWDAPRLILPVLGRSYGETLDAGEFGLRFDPVAAHFHMTYLDLAVPLAPPTYADILATMGPDLADIARAFADCDADSVAATRVDLLHALERNCVRFEAELAGFAGRAEAIHNLHEKQHWRLAHWRLGREVLTYRRFFEITGLAGVRVEDPAVFDAVHEFVLGLVRNSVVDGLRIDHIDGLARPTAYLNRLAAAVGDRARLWVEKILEGAEDVRPDWPVAGTTGYEFIAALAGLLIDPSGKEGFERAYRGFLTDDRPCDDEWQIKRRILTHNLAAELRELAKRAGASLASDIVGRDVGHDTLREAIVALMAAMPVYRTYSGGAELGPSDCAVIESAAAEAQQLADLEDSTPIDLIVRVLKGDDPRDHTPEAQRFVTRFEQTSGPVMAKAIEDTLFYRTNRLVGLNEVGGNPDDFGAPVSLFHERMASRAARQPQGLSATATHDTKRGEDARARLYSLSERPKEWSRIVTAIAEQMRPFRTPLKNGLAPEPNIEWMIYQVAFAGWPLGLAPDDANAMKAYSRRLSDCVLKSIREAKLRTSWTAQDERYEAAVLNFCASMLNPEGVARLASHLFEPLFVAGALNGLVQTLLKVTAPGVPDIYQGCEFWDFSFVDPDNRRPINLKGIAEASQSAMIESPEVLLEQWKSGAIKQRVLVAGLAARRRNPDLFAAGGYRSLRVAGRRADNVIAFCRRAGGKSALILAPIRASHAAAPSKPMIPPEFWGDTSISLESDLSNHIWSEMVSGKKVELAGEVPVARMLCDLPVAMFVSGYS